MYCQKNKSVLYMLIFANIFLITFMSFGQENLDEMIRRKSRYASAYWGKAYLEDPSTYVWQSESFCYTDITTGHEVWIVAHAPDRGIMFSNEYATQAWSYNGSTIGFFTSRTNMGTNNPQCPSDNGSYADRRWLVKSDGSYLKCAEGYGHNDLPEGGFGWANTENAYYAFGGGTDVDGATNVQLCKMIVDYNNQVTGSILLNTYSASNGDQSKGIAITKKNFIKRAVSAKDDWLSVSAIIDRDYGRHINCNGYMRIYLNRGINPRIENYWGVARNGQDYDGHDDSHENRAHGGAEWPMGFNHEYLIIQYSGGEGMFYRLKTSGSDIDGGPLAELWDGDSYGQDEVYPFALDQAPFPPGWFHPYWNHPSLDRWEKYRLDAVEEGGSAVLLVENPGNDIDTYDVTKMGWDGSSGLIDRDLTTGYNFGGVHSAWDGWTDQLAWFPYRVNGESMIYKIMYGRQLNFTSKTLGPAYQIVNTHYTGEFGDGEPYYSLPRPSQSPDGTKVAFHAVWLNNSDNYPYLTWAVAYYPYPPKQLGTSYNNGIKLTWVPPQYTTRGWPNEDTDPAPYAREIKAYHIWRSMEQSSNWNEIGFVTAKYNFDNYFGVVPDLNQLTYTDNPADGTYYYAITSEEYSGLESRELSEILRVSYSNGTITNSGIIQAQGKKNFWAKVPSAPLNFSFLSTAVPGHNKLNWIEPGDDKIRYYNIYYSTTSIPPPQREYRIASVPAGKSSYLDWCAQQGSSAFYSITSVDRQGNEGTVVTGKSGPLKPKNVQIKK